MNVKLKAKLGKKMTLCFPNKRFILTAEPFTVSKKDYDRFLFKYVDEIKADSVSAKPKITPIG